MSGRMISLGGRGRGTRAFSKARGTSDDRLCWKFFWKRFLGKTKAVGVFFFLVGKRVLGEFYLDFFPGHPRIFLQKTFAAGRPGKTTCPAGKTFLGEEDLGFYHGFPRGV